MTYSESVTWKRLPYLWMHMSKKFFNPFDKKSCLLNLKESLQSFIDAPLEKKYTDVNDISELIDRNQIKLNLKTETKKLTEFEEKTNIDNENHITRSISGIIFYIYKEYGFVSKSKECYYNQFYGDQETSINWTKYRIYTLMDIYNSPMKKIVEEKLKKEQLVA